MKSAITLDSPCFRKLNPNSAGTVNVVNVNTDTDFSLDGHANGLTIDVTLKPSTVDFTDTDANANLAVVNSVYVPTTSMTPLQGCVRQAGTTT